jgi:hypothetical protein
VKYVSIERVNLRFLSETVFSDRCHSDTHYEIAYLSPCRTDAYLHKENLVHRFLEGSQ